MILFASRFSAGNKPVLVHKYTGWLRLGFFRNIILEAKFTHVVRDGRVVANSWLQTTWWRGYQGPQQRLWGPLSEEHFELCKTHNQSLVTLASTCWLKLMESYIVTSQSMSSEHYLETKYEDLTTNLILQAGRVLGFTGLGWLSDFEKQLDRFNIGDSRARAFENSLTTMQQQTFESVVAEMLEKYGYTLSYKGDCDS